MNEIQRIPVLIDSGAFGNVFPTNECSDVPSPGTNTSKSGYACEVARGHKTINDGQCDVVFLSQHGVA